MQLFIGCTNSLGTSSGKNSSDMADQAKRTLIKPVQSQKTNENAEVGWGAIIISFKL